MDLPGDFEIMEVRIPKPIVGMTLKDLDIKNKFEAHIVTVIKQTPTKNIFGNQVMNANVFGILHSNLCLEADDILLILVNQKTSTAFLHHYNGHWGFSRKKLIFYLMCKILIIKLVNICCFNNS